ncbi:recombinase family protein [Streptomyces canus]|uniref:recombinase family protein n=1 Tax=Streptomyces canus TaxID=58343 RepID=UPI0022584489|nr:recombinase family protein [Streptomyces canus]MCX4858385.1 recombinase family protein [Streptomyces canus]
MYGFDNQALTRVRADERQVVREAVSRIRAGQSQAEVAAWMTAEGHRGTMGGEWTSMTLGRLLDNPAIAGLERAPHTGELVETGRQALITPEEFRELEQRPGRRGSVRSGESREPNYEYLLAGGATVCGQCSTPMTGGRTGAGTPSYRCQTSRGGCGKVRITASLLEDHVAEHVLGELARPGSRTSLDQARKEAEVEAQQLRERIGKLEESRAELAAPYAAGQVSRDAFVAADKHITESLKAARSRLRFVEQAADVPLGGVEDLARWWEHAPYSSRRALVLLLLNRIVVRPARARGVRDVDDRVDLNWRAADAA